MELPLLQTSGRSPLQLHLHAVSRGWASWKAVTAMAEDGWPLGLGALNERAGLPGAANRSGSSVSFGTNFTSSHCASSLPSTDFDTESAWSLPRTRGGVTLASLIGIVDAMDSRRHPSARAARSGKLRALLLSLCLRSHMGNGSGAPSLAQFLEMERRASGGSRHAHGI